MTFFQIFLLALIQGAAELLPVSSSAHVIVGAKLMNLDPSSPEMTLLLVMLHTGTMFAVIIYFWKSWKKTFFSSLPVFIDAVKNIGMATALTGVVGLSLKEIIEKVFMRNTEHSEIEHLFGNLFLVSGALFAAGLLIITAAVMTQKKSDKKNAAAVDLKKSGIIGIVQGICLPFRGFSRSGATISTGLLVGVSRSRAEEFSFALAVVLTPPVILREVLRLLKARQNVDFDIHTLSSMFAPGLIGMFLSFLAGLIALRWLSSWLEKGRWHFFGIYCLAFSAFVFILYLNGY